MNGPTIFCKISNLSTMIINFYVIGLKNYKEFILILIIQ